MKRYSFPVILLVLYSFIGTSKTFGQDDSNFKPSGKFIGQVFGDYYYKMHADQYARGNGMYSGIAKDFSNFDIRRIYLGYNYDISPSFAAELLLAYEQNNDGNGNRTFFVKHANIRWKNIFSNADLLFGAQPTPSFALLSEKIWSYRSVEKTLLDKNGVAKSNDVGLGLQGAFDDERNFGYDILYANGAGAKPETDRYKKIYGDLWAKFADKKIILNVYGDYNELQGSPYMKASSALKFFAAYQTKALTIGVEAFMQTLTNSVLIFHNNQDSSLPKVPNDSLSSKPFGLSVFVTGEIVENKIGFFARFDMFNPDQSYEATGRSYPSGYNTNNENFIVAGLDWTPYANVHIMPNIWYTGFSNKLTTATDKLKSDNDIVPRVTVFYKY